MCFSFEIMICAGGIKLKLLWSGRTANMAYQELQQEWFSMKVCQRLKRLFSAFFHSKYSPCRTRHTPKRQGYAKHFFEHQPVYVLTCFGRHIYNYIYRWSFPQFTIMWQVATQNKLKRWILYCKPKFLLEHHDVSWYFPWYSIVLSMLYLDHW